MDSITKNRNSLAFEIQVRLGERLYRISLKSSGTWAITAVIILAQLVPQLLSIWRGGT